MQRICNSLQLNGYDVELVGVLRNQSTQTSVQRFKQKRIPVFFEKGFLFYAEYNFRLFFYLLFSDFNAVCAIDLDTIIPCYFSSVLKRKKRVYDAHEIFTEMKEVLEDKFVLSFWKAVEKLFVPKFKNGYTVNNFLKKEFEKRYGSNYSIIRNMPLLNEVSNVKPKQNFIIYQGAVNEGRAFEQLIPAMQFVDIELRIYGTGNFLAQTKALIEQYNVYDKVKLMGPALPADLKEITPTALLGITIFQQEGMNQYYSLANRFFDYIMAEIPQVCVNYPEYQIINNEFNIALLIDDVTPNKIAEAINTMLDNKELYNTLQQNCINAKKVLNWQSEERKLIEFWNKII